MLTIGSIIYLKDGSQKVMILNRGPLVEMNGEQYMFDYSACPYPLGLVEDNIYYFNEENVDKVIFEGYSDEDEIRFQELYKQALKEEFNNYKKGQVNKPLETDQFGLN